MIGTSNKRLIFQVCVKDRRNRNEPNEASCLDYGLVYGKTLERLRQAADAKKQKRVIIEPRPTTTPTTPTPASQQR